MKTSLHMNTKFSLCMDADTHFLHRYQLIHSLYFFFLPLSFLICHIILAKMTEHILSIHMLSLFPTHCSGALAKIVFGPHQAKTRLNTQLPLLYLHGPHAHPCHSHFFGRVEHCTAVRHILAHALVFGT